jgi:hypothetical protein
VYETRVSYLKADWKGRRSPQVEQATSRPSVSRDSHGDPAKFRDDVRSKSDTAMKNEVYCKFLCNNICVVHQSHIELGIEPVFWSDEPAGDEQPMILSLRRGG